MRTHVELEEVAARLLARDPSVASIAERLLLGCNRSELGFLSRRLLPSGVAPAARTQAVGALRDALVANGGLVRLLGLLDDCRMVGQAAQAVCLVQRSQQWDESTLPKLRRVISDARRAGLAGVDAEQLPCQETRQRVVRAQAILPALDLVLQTAESRLSCRQQTDASAVVRARRRTHATHEPAPAQALALAASSAQLGEAVVEAIKAELHEVSGRVGWVGGGGVVRPGQSRGDGGLVGQ